MIQGPVGDSGSLTLRHSAWRRLGMEVAGTPYFSPMLILERVIAGWATAFG